MSRLLFFRCFRECLRAAIAALGMALLFAALTLRAEDSPDPANPAEPRLGPRQQSFEELSAEEKERLRESWRKHHELSAEEQKRIETQYGVWKDLDPEQRKTLTRLHRQLQKAPPEVRQKVCQKLGEFNALPPDRQKELLQKMTEKRLQQKNGAGKHGPFKPPSAEKQAELRSRYAIWDGLSPKEQRVLAMMEQRLEQAPPEVRQKLQERIDKFRQMPAEKQKTILGKMASHQKGKPGRGDAGLAPASRPEPDRL